MLVAVQQSFDSRQNLYEGPFHPLSFLEVEEKSLRNDLEFMKKVVAIDPLFGYVFALENLRPYLKEYVIKSCNEKGLALAYEGLFEKWDRK